MYFLRQSTASQEVLLGPFVDSTDGNTAKTGLTIANTDIKLHVAGATTLASKNSGGGTHISNGNYYCVLDATDTATLGSGAIVVQVATALAVRHPFTVLSANIYDSFILGTDLFDVSTVQWTGTAVTAPSTAGTPKVDISLINGSATTLAAHAAMLDSIVVGTVSTANNAGSATTFRCANITEATASHYVGKQVYIRSGAQAGMWWGVVTAYALTSGEGAFTVSPGCTTADGALANAVTLFLV